MRRWLATLGVFALGAAFVAAGIFGIAQATVLSDAGDAPTERAIKPVGVEKTLPKPIEESANADEADKEETEETEKKPEEEKPEQAYGDPGDHVAVMLEKRVIQLHEPE